MSDYPAIIGRYRIEALLGRGAMGLVCKAYDPAIDRSVAIKLIHADLLREDERLDYLERFRREAQAVGRCTHGNIVALYDVLDHQGEPCLVMEYVEGDALDKVLAGNPKLSEAAAISITLQVLDALACAHAAGIVHRDIKPGNILLRRDGQARDGQARVGQARDGHARDADPQVSNAQVKVTDFGISRLPMSDMTQIGTMMGTPSYMSPEQARGEACGAPSDLFSVASVLYEMLAGRKPFAGNSLSAILARLLHDEAPPLVDASPAICAVIARAHAKRPEQRYPSAAAMREALRGAVRLSAMPPVSPDAAPEEATVVRPPVGPIGGTQAAWCQTASAPWHAGDLDVVTRDLARHLGPIARVLVSRAVAAGAPSLAALRDVLAGEIKDERARQSFRRGG